MKQYYIYLTTNLTNGMKYIGKHYGELDDSYLGSGKLLREEIQKIGKEYFSKEILYISQSEQENENKEREYIALYNAVSNPMFYNIHVGGAGGNTTAGYSAEEKAALRAKLSELQTGINNGMYGKHHSDKTKAFLSYWATYQRNNDVYRTTEFREKMSDRMAGEKNGMYGKKHSEESKKLMSEHSIGKTLGEKNGMYGKKGEKALNGKNIAMYNEQWELIKIFPAKTAVLEFLGMKGHTQLDKAIKNQTLYKGYYWKQVAKNQD